MFPHSLFLSSGTSTHRNPSGASPGGLCVGWVQSFFGSLAINVPMACSTPIAAIAQSIQKSIGSTVTVPSRSVRSVCDGEYVAASRLRPAAGVESPPSVVTAPGGVTQRRGTPRKSNRLQWLQIELFLEDLAKRPGVSS